MLKNKLFFIALIFTLLFSSFVYATDDVMLISDDENANTTNNWINSDINLTTDNYLLDTTIVGNAFFSRYRFYYES